MKHTSSRIGIIGKLVALTVLGAHLAGARHASAQSCSVSIEDVPDFDQRRTSASNALGLPGGGEMYCVPTSFANWMAYISNHGLPEVMDGPRDWQSQDNYNFVTDRIEHIGELMLTDAEEGTTIGSVTGAIAYLNEVAPGAFTVGGMAALAGLHPTPEMLYDAMDGGGLVSLTLGKYERNEFTAFERVGGHVVSLTKIEGGCSSHPTLTWHNPSTQDSTTVQASFNQQSSDVDEVTDLFATPLGWGVPTTLWRYELYDEGDTQRFFDSYLVVTPTVALTTDDQWDTAEVNTTGATTGGEPEQQGSADTPNGNVLDGLAFHPLHHGRFFATTEDDDDSSTLYEYDPKAALLREVMRLLRRSPIVTGRHGDLYVVNGNSLLQLDATRPDADPRPLHQYDLHGELPTTMVYDDTTDTLTLLFPEKHRTLTLSRDLKRVSDLSLPSNVELRGAPLMANTTQDDSIWFGSEESNVVYELRESSKRGWQVLRSVKLPISGGPSALQVTESGNLVVVQEGYAREFSYDRRSGRWYDEKRSVIAGMKAGRRFVLSRSRNNFDDATLSAPGWSNYAPEPEDKL